MVAVWVNGHAVQSVAIVQRGRVLLPLRATAEALGAAIDFDAARKLVIVKAAHRRIEIPPQLIDGRAYVPLRFIAQSLDASVSYDASAHRVAITTLRLPAFSHLSRPVNVSQLTPSDQSRVPTAYPAISATIGASAADAKAVHLAVDGVDVTPLATFDGATITYLPRKPLGEGTHTVVFSGTAAGGSAFTTSWNFQTTQQAPPDVPAQYFDRYGYSFFSNGYGGYRPGDWMHFTLIAPPGGSAFMQMCGLGYDYPLWNGGDGTQYVANVPAPYGYWISGCPVTATYTTWDGQTIVVAQPVYINLYTLPMIPQIVATPAPARRPIPLPSSEPRRPEPSASPHPFRSALPATPPPVATPMPVRVPRPKPRVTPASIA